MTKASRGLWHHAADVTGRSRNNVSHSQAILRSAASNISPAIFPIEVVDPWGGLARARCLNEADYGMLVLMNHFSVRDAVQVLMLLFACPVLGRRTVLAPVARHQYLQYGAVGRILARCFAIRMLPVVTGDTVKKLGWHYPQGTGRDAYLNAATEGLSRGQIVLLAPQGGRRSSLGQPRGRPVGRLVAQATAFGAKRFAFLFLGLSLPGATDYSLGRVGGFNFGRRYTVHVGRTTTWAEARLHQRQQAKWRNADEWAFDKLRLLLPSTYVQGG